jgi:hypothetical protein
MIDLGGFVPYNPTRFSSSMHESGHCVVSTALGKRVWSVSVKENGGGEFLQSAEGATERPWAEVCNRLRAAENVHAFEPLRAI